MSNIVKLPRRRFSSSFLRAMDAARAFKAAAPSADQLVELAISKLRDGTTEAELIEVTGWSILQVRGFLHGFLAEPAMGNVAVYVEGEKVNYKLLDVAAL